MNYSREVAVGEIYIRMCLIWKHTAYKYANVKGPDNYDRRTATFAFSLAAMGSKVVSDNKRSEGIIN